MKQKLVKYEAGEPVAHMTDSLAKEVHFNEYIKWIRGEKIPCHWSKNQITTWTDFTIKGGNIEAKIGDKIWFSISFPNDRKNWLFIDLDFKRLELEEGELVRFKEEIEDCISIDENLNGRVRSVVRSGEMSKNGLHILIWSASTINAQKVIKNFTTHLSSCVSREFCDQFTKPGFIDASSTSKNRWFKAQFGIGVSHLNTNSNWITDIEVEVSKKLAVPDIYQSGFHTLLSSWLYRQNSTLEEILALYGNDLEKRPFKDPNKTLGEEIKRLWKWTSKTTEIKKILASDEIFYLDEKGKLKLDSNKLSKMIFTNWDFINESDDIMWVKKAGEKRWKSYYKNRELGRWDFIPMILEYFNLCDIEKEKVVALEIAKILSIRKLDGNLPKRDLDTWKSVTLTIKDKFDKIHQIEVTDKSVKLVEKEFISGIEATLPIKSLDLKWKLDDFHLYKIGFFRNIIRDENQYFKIIGFLNHSDSSTTNGLRFVVHSDAVEDMQGGTGKTLCTKVATYLKNTVEVKYNNSSASDSFFLQNCDRTTHILSIDEFPKEGNIEFFREFYNPSPKFVNKKFKQPIKIDPIKLIINTNYNLSESNPDKERRVEISFKKFYDRATNPVSKSLGYNAFTDSRLHYLDEFKTDLGEVINTNDWWNQYLCFIIHCIQLYLSDINTRFVDMVDQGAKWNMKHENYLKNTKTCEVYTEVIQNLERIISEGGVEIKIRNTELCDIRKFKTNTLGVLNYMIETYLNAHTSWRYSGKISDSKGIIHIIKKKETTNENI